MKYIIIFLYISHGRVHGGTLSQNSYKPSRNLLEVLRSTFLVQRLARSLSTNKETDREKSFYFVLIDVCIVTSGNQTVKAGSINIKIVVIFVARRLILIVNLQTN